MKILLGLLIAIFVLSLSIDVQANEILKKNKQIKKTKHIKNLHDKSNNPKKIRTKIQMIKSVIHGFLAQLELPDRICEKKIKVASLSNLMKIMRLFKHVRKGTSKPDDLAKIKDYLNYPDIGDRLKNEKYKGNALKYLKKYIH